MPGSGKYAKQQSGVDIGATEFLSSSSMPTFVQGTTGATTDVVSTSVTTGTLGATPTAGNLLVLAVFWQNSPAITNPSGWGTPIHSINDGTSFKTAIYTKIATGSESTSQTVSFTVSALSGGAAVILEEWTGVDGTTPIEITADGTAVTTGVDATAIAITGGANPAQTNDIAITYAGWRQTPTLTLGTGATGTTWSAQTAKFSTSGTTGNNLISAESAVSSSTLSTSSAASFAGTLASARRFGVAMLVVKASVPTSPPSNSTLPVISPTTGIVVGSSLSTTNGTWTNSPTSFTYQWKRNGTNISSATSSSYTVQVADAGANITVTVTATNTAGSASATSNAVTMPDVPANSVAPGASGATSQGSTLTVTNGSWTNSPTSFTYQWRRDGVNISGATSATYSIVGGDLGHTLVARITAINSFGSGTADSNSISIPSSAYGQGPAVVGLEILEWPSTILNTSVPATGWSNFTPVLFPLSPAGLPIFSAKVMRTSAATTPTSSQVNMAIYTYNYTATNTFTATLVATTGAANAVNILQANIISGPVDLDFTQNRYFVGIMTNLAPIIRHDNTPLPSAFSVIQFSSARASLTDWPASFNQSNVVPYSVGYPYIALGTTTSTWFL
jgi:hypothetical protein